jgi:hypothetical protein
MKNAKILILGLVLGATRCVIADTTCGPHGCSFPSDVWCYTYSETYIETVPNSTPTPHTDILYNNTECNCGAPDCENGSNPLNPYNGSDNWSYQETESITHSTSGSDTAGVGLDVGKKDVAMLKLNYAVTASNGWQETDTHSVTINKTWTFSIAPYKYDTDIASGVWLDGAVTGSSHYHALANNGILGNGFKSYQSDCWYTTSTASGANHYVSTSGGPAEYDCSE